MMFWPPLRILVLKDKLSHIDFVINLGRIPVCYMTTYYKEHTICVHEHDTQLIVT